MKKLIIGIILVLLLASQAQAVQKTVTVEKKLLASEYGKLGDWLGFGDRVYKITYSNGNTNYQLVRGGSLNTAQLVWIQNNIQVSSGQSISIGYTVKGTNVDGNPSHAHEIELYDDDTKKYIATKTWELTSTQSRGDNFIISPMSDGVHNFFLYEYVYLLLCENNVCSYKKTTDIENQKYTTVTVGLKPTPTPTPTSTKTGECKDSYGNIYSCGTPTLTATATATATAAATATATATAAATATATATAAATATSAGTPSATTTSSVDTTSSAGGGGITYRGVDIRIDGGAYYVGDIPHDSIAEAKKTIDEMIEGKEKKQSIFDSIEPLWVVIAIVAIGGGYVVLSKKSSKGKSKKKGK